jgi:hypothetical protein
MPEIDYVRASRALRDYVAFVESLPPTGRTRSERIKRLALEQHAIDIHNILRDRALVIDPQADIPLLVTPAASIVPGQVGRGSRYRPLFSAIATMMTLATFFTQLVVLDEALSPENRLSNAFLLDPNIASSIS